MNASEKPESTLPFEVARRIDPICDCFEKEWSAGRSPRIEDFLPRVEPADQPFLLRELLALEMELHRRQGAQVEPIEFETRFPRELEQIKELFTPSVAKNQPTTKSHVPTPPAAELDGAPAIPGYVILQVLGRGGMGIVYQARDVQLERVVAIKMIRHGNLVDSDVIKRFLQEAREVAQLHHPHIVQIYELGEHAGMPYFTMEYCSAGNLRDRIAGEPREASLAAQWVQDIASGVAHAHVQGIIHRDLKPLNVLVSADGQMKVADFGLARKLEVGKEHFSTQAIKGTPSYMAPEQFQEGGKQIGARTDVFALGAILYECVTGRPPFLGTGVMETMKLVCNTDPIPPRQLNPKVPRDLELICLKCLEKQPNRRYASALLLQEELQRFRNGEPLKLTRKVSRVERGWRWCVRNPALALTGAAAGLLLISSVVILIIHLLQMDVVNDHLKNENIAKNNALKQSGDRLKEIQRFTRISAALAFERGNSLCESGDIHTGMLWLIRALEIAGAEAPELQIPVRSCIAGWRRQMPELQMIYAMDGDDAGHGFFSPDGSLIVKKGYGHEPKTAVWETETGLLRAEFPGGAGNSIPSFTRDGKLFSIGTRDGFIGLLQSEDCKLLDWTPDKVDVPGQNELTISPDGLTAYVRGWESGSKVQLWNLKERRPVGFRLPIAGLLLQLVYSPNGSLLVTLCDSGQVQRWDPRTGKEVGEPIQRSKDLREIVFLPDSNSFLIEDGDRIAHYRADTGLKIAETRLSSGNNSIVGVTPDGKRVLIHLSLEKAILILDTATLAGNDASRLSGVFEGKPELSPDGVTLLEAMQDRIEFWAVSTKMQRSASLPIIPLMRNPKFHPNGKMFMTTFLGVLRLWNLPAGPWLTAPLTHPESVGHATLSPDGRRILTTCQDYILRTWDVVTGQSQGAELLHRGQISGLAFTENGNLCTSGYRSLSILDLTQQKEVFALSGGVVVELAPRGGKGVMYDKTAQLFDSINNQLIGPPFPIPYQKTSYVQFSPDGNSIVYCADRNAWVVDTGTGKTIFDPIEHDGNILKASFSVDGRLLFTSGDNGVIRLWDARTGKALDVKFKQDGSFFEKVAFLADKNRLFAFQENPQRKGFIWEVTSGKLLGSFDVPGINGFIGPSEDGTTILWTGWTGNKTQAAMWDADTYQRIDDPMERRKRCIDPLIGEYRFPDQIERPGFGKALGFTPGGRAYIAQPQRGRYMVLDTATGLPLGPAIKPPGGPGLITFSRDGRSILTASGSHVLLWPVSDPQQGAADDLRLWAEVKTGMELDDAGEVQILSPAVWKERLRLLKERDVVSRQIGDTPAPPPYVHSTVQAAKITRRWLSDGGNFERRASGQWIERVKSERFIFEEVKSTREYVELVDKSRDLGARLYADKLLLRYPKEKDFRFFRKGRWEPNTEFEVAPLPREVKP